MRCNVKVEFFFFFVFLSYAYHIDWTSGDYYSFVFYIMSIRYTKISNSLQLNSNSLPIMNMTKPSQVDIDQMIQYARVRKIK